MIFSNKQKIRIGLFLGGITVLSFGIYLFLKSRQAETSSTPEVIRPQNIYSIKSITAVDDLTDVAYSQSKHLNYVASFDESKIYVINMGTSEKEGEIPIDYPNRMLIDDQSDVLYVSAGPQSVAEVSLDSFQVIRTIGVGSRPSQMVMSTDRRYLFVVNEYSNDVSVVDLVLFSTIKTIPVGNRPLDIALSSDGESLYVANRDDATISKISVSNLSVVDTITNVGRVVKIEAFPVNNLILSLDQYSNRLLVIDGNTNEVISQIETVDYPIDFSINQAKKEVYVLSFTTNTVGIVALDKAITNREIRLSSAFETGAGANNIRYDSKQNKILVTNTNTGKVYVVSLDL